VTHSKYRHSKQDLEQKVSVWWLLLAAHRSILHGALPLQQECGYQPEATKPASCDGALTIEAAVTSRNESINNRPSGVHKIDPCWKIHSCAALFYCETAHRNPPQVRDPTASMGIESLAEAGPEHSTHANYPKQLK
jgi:hypothetical protein